MFGKAELNELSMKSKAIGGTSGLYLEVCSRWGKMGIIKKKDGANLAKNRTVYQLV